MIVARNIIGNIIWGSLKIIQILVLFTFYREKHVFFIDPFMFCYVYYNVMYCIYIETMSYVLVYFARIWTPSSHRAVIQRWVGSLKLYCDVPVMGIKGRRVHMIEELSDTIISFQRGMKAWEELAWCAGLYSKLAYLYIQKITL